MPGTSRRRPGAQSIISSVSGPKVSTIARAVLGPMPRISPEARYSSISANPSGRTGRMPEALKRRPYWLCCCQSPSTSTYSPSFIAAKLPHTVVSSSFPASSKTV
ncbi:MAG: hypothetical protein L6V89_07605 [Oscillospiraceae bacterium]|nr:MAG: hypothetical protein L6V89_07605 [Oscillospiraceae bacterium]